MTIRAVRMTSNPTNTSALSQGLALNEDWQELVNLDGVDGEIYDPFFQNNLGVTIPPVDYHETSQSNPYATESVASEQRYEPSSATHAVDGYSSFEYAVSAPPSDIDGPSSLGQGHSWLSGSPSYTTSATSPLVGRSGLPYPGSFDACEGSQSPLRISTESPFLDAQSYGSSSSYQTASASIFNPYMAGSPHAFSGLDVSASQAFSNVGTWVEPSIDSIPEMDPGGAMPIPIPHSGSQSFSNTFSPHPWTTDSPEPQTRARAITIPQSHRQQPDLQQQQGVQRVPPLLPVSPETRRLPRSVPLSRNVSRSEPRRSKNRLMTPSPTSHTFGWVSYQPNAHTNRLVPSETEGSRGRRQRGRVGALTAEQRSHAALMRLVGSCSNCKRRKEKCDPGTPCKSCLDHYKGDLIKHPCRNQLLSDLSSAFLAQRLGWHPIPRAIESFIACDSYQVHDEYSYPIPLSFGFGPAVHVYVHTIHVEEADALFHEHVVYSWPPGSSSEEIHTHAVLPAVLTPDASFNLTETLDNHLSFLVMQHFRSFPLYCSQLRILKDVYVFYRSLPANTPYSRVLHQALKLLVLVHVGGDITLPSPSTDPVLEQLVLNTMSLSEPITPTPCFIRSQFGSIMPSLALNLMREVLLSLEQLLLNRECHEWPVALATLIVVLMTIESIQYHAAKLPYHHSYDSGISRSKQEHDSKGDDEGVKSLLAFYSACFPGCHARLRPDWEGGSHSGSQPGSLTGSSLSPDDKFIDSVREAIRKASPEYLQKRAKATRAGNDMGFFFDRLAARLLVLSPS